MWSCDPETVAHVTSTGLVTSVAEGKAVVVASDKKNPAHFDQSLVRVTQVFTLEKLMFAYNSPIL